MRIDLAKENDQGCAWLCSQCDDVHLRWENLVVTLPRERFEKFARLAETAGKKLVQMKAAPTEEQATAMGKTWLQ